MPLIDGVLDFIFPGRCAGCLGGYDRGAILCRECEQQLENLAVAPACEICAMPMTEHGAPCPYCLGKGAPFFDRIVSIGVFQEPLRSLIHRGKYSGDWPMMETLADRLMEKESVRSLLEQTDLLVAVPLHYGRQVGRGYNQADVIAKRLGGRWGVKSVKPVVRQRRTETQTYLHSRAQRVENMEDAFRLARSGQIAGKRVVLVDDVMTSGATLSAVARTLAAAKPARLSALVLAVADPKGRGFEAI
jgi:ComF family protein